MKSPLQFEVTFLEPEDASSFVDLQDELADYHLNMIRTKLYKKVTKEDVLSFFCPDKFIGDREGRVNNVLEILKRRKAIFRDVYIIKVTCFGKGVESHLVGYILYVIEDDEWRRSPAGGKGRARMTKHRYVKVNQFYVKKGYRGMGVGKKLFQSMREAVKEAGEDIRVSVCELNTEAVQWYYKLGFDLDKMKRDTVGESAENILVFYGMRLLSGDLQPELKDKALPIFQSEIVGKVLTIWYPKDNSKEQLIPYKMKVVKYMPQERWHCLNSAGLSTWDGDSFSDTLDLNDFFKLFRVSFDEQSLSKFFHDQEVEKQRVRAKQAQERELKRQRDALEKAERERQAAELKRRAATPAEPVSKKRQRVA